MKRFSQLAIPYIVWAAMMLILPMGLIALYSVTEHGNSIISFSFTLDHYVKFFSDPDFLLVLWRSCGIAIKTTVICLLLGYPVAYFISKSSERLQNILVLCITVPTWINMLVRTYAWIGLLSDGGLFQQILGFFGFEEVSFEGYLFNAFTTVGLRLQFLCRNKHVFRSFRQKGIPCRRVTVRVEERC